MPLSVELHQRFTEQAAWTLDARKLFLQSSGILPESKILEAGCGTGAVLSSLKSLLGARAFGIDINPEIVRFASAVVPESFLTSADAYRIPFPESSFDAVVCHYLLLWVKNPEAIMMEFMRVTRPGGFIALLAEPDYGSRIEYPSALEKAGRLQREALIHQGANPDIGRQIREILAKSGCINISTGILGSYQTETGESDGYLEQLMLQDDLSEIMKPAEIKKFLVLDRKAREEQSRVQFIPTFFGWGRKPNFFK